MLTKNEPSKISIDFSESLMKYISLGKIEDAVGCQSILEI